jgi:predicted acylesterase/phospholipase RssA
MSTREPLPGFEDHAPRNRYCDLILTGGVTSSIAYPPAIFALATLYRFNSIGGASSGAGAAALAAAAEYRRRHGSSDGFRIMLERAEAIAEDVDGKTRLAWLFQPTRDNRRLFDALLPGFAQPSGKLMQLVRGVLSAYLKSPVVLGILFVLTLIWLVAIGRAVHGYIDWTSAFLIGLIATIISVILVLGAAFLLAVRDVGCLLRNDYGLCTGTRAGAAPVQPFTDWLHGLIQEIAGRKASDRPLTFADLAEAPGSPRETLNDFNPTGTVSINLQMFTANVTHGRPYVFPQSEDEEDDRTLYFRVSEMERLFPPDVVAAMKADPVTGQSNEYEGRARPVRLVPVKPSFGEMVWSTVMGKTPVVGAEQEPMYRLPARHLPILVAARMSVSFPILFSAVPLWIEDRRDPDNPVFRRCLFCDGGICSNFPIHLFDSPIPSWPTFGVSLHELSASKEGEVTSAKGMANAASCAPTAYANDYGKVDLPDNQLQLGDDNWNEFETERDPVDRIAGFFGALASTTINWSDATLARLPGVRERVVRVGLRRGIGGLNVLMDKDQIRGLADLGRLAALKLIKRYAFSAAQSGGGLSNGWDEHRWVRLNVMRDSLARSLAGVSWASSQRDNGKSLRDLIRQAIDEPILKTEECAAGTKNNGTDAAKDSQLLPAQAAALEGTLDALMQAERALNMTTVGQPYKPLPRPVMRVRPPL